MRTIAGQAHRLPMDLRQLRYFVGIVDAGSMTAAAERLHVAQSALSQHVRRLEENLGVRLLVRERTGVVPTAAGRKLVDHARRILAQVKCAEAEIRSAAARPAGSVAIGIPAGVGRVLNAPLLHAAREFLPDVSLRIVEVAPTHVLDWLDSGRIDLGIHYELGPCARDSVLLASEDLYLVSATPEPVAESGIALEELVDFPLIMPTCEGKPPHCIVTFAEARGIALQVESRVDSLSTIIDLAITQPGRCVLTPAAFLPEWRAGKLFAYPLVPRVSRTVHLGSSSARRFDPASVAVEALVPRVASMLQQQNNWPRRVPEAAAQLN